MPAMSDQLARKTSSPAAPVGNHAWGGWRIPLAVAGVALLFRLWVILRGGGLYALMGYDDVREAAAHEPLSEADG